MDHDTQRAQKVQSKERNIYSEVMNTIQCANPPHHHNDFVATCRLWTASARVPALLVQEPVECLTSTRLHYVCITLLAS